MSDPHRYDIEQSVLATVIAKPHLLRHAREAGLQGEHFADALLGRTWDRVCGFADEGRVANALTLYPATAADPAFTTPGHMPKKAGPWLTSLVSLDHIVSTRPETVEDYAVALVDLHRRRQCIEQYGDAIRRMNRQDPEEPAAQIAAEVAQATTRAAPLQNLLTEQDVGEEVVAAILHPPPCYPTGLPTLDEALGGGLYQRKVYGIGARKKSGKTMLLSTISYNLTLANTPHLFITLEMTPVQIAQRKAARFLDINPNVFLGHPAPGLAQRAAEYFAQAGQGCHYWHAPGASLETVLGQIATAVASQGVAGVLIDYQQLIRGRHDRQTQAEHQEFVAQDIANLCSRLNIWCVMAAQLNQEGNTRGGEGLRLAADLYFVLHREATKQGGWLEMQDSRYVPHRNVGDEAIPGIYLRQGCYFSEEPGD